MAGVQVTNEMETNQGAPLATSSHVETSWSSLFQQGNANKLKTTLKHFKPNFVNGIAEVPEEVIEKGCKDWEDYLVGSFVGKRLPFPFVKSILQKEWKMQNFEMVADEEVFYFKFFSDEDKMAVIEKGPIFIAGRLFVLRLWSPEVENGRKLISSLPIWVKLEGVPKRLWTAEGLGFLASLIGKPVCLDEATEKKTRLNFAKVCIEVDVECAFPKLVKAKLGEEVVEVKVEYNWIPSKCTKCSSFGHLTNRCVKKVTSTWQRSAEAGPSCVRNSQGEEIAEQEQVSLNCGNESKACENTRNPGSPNRVGIQKQSLEPNTNNRFECLQDIQEEPEKRMETQIVVQPVVRGSMEVEFSVNGEGEIDNEEIMIPKETSGGFDALNVEGEQQNDEEEATNSLVAKEANAIMDKIKQVEALAPTKNQVPVKVVSDVEVDYCTPSVVGRSKTAQHIYFKSPSSLEAVDFDETCSNEEVPETYLDDQLARAAEAWADMLVQEEGEWSKGKKKDKKPNWKEKARKPLSR